MHVSCKPFVGVKAVRQRLRFGVPDLACSAEPSRGRRSVRRQAARQLRGGGGSLRRLSQRLGAPFLPDHDACNVDHDACNVGGPFLACFGRLMASIAASWEYWMHCQRSFFARGMRWQSHVQALAAQMSCILARRPGIYVAAPLAGACVRPLQDTGTTNRKVLPRLCNGEQ